MFRYPLHSVDRRAQRTLNLVLRMALLLLIHTQASVDALMTMSFYFLSLSYFVTITLLEPSISGTLIPGLMPKEFANIQVDRGAGASQGRTSWTSKPEVYDYISFVGFFLHYLDALRLPYHGEPTPTSPDAPLAPIPTGVELGNPSEEAQSELTLILSGYSYGSLITTQLPLIDEILKRFAHVNQGTSEAEIRLRASSLASQWNRDAQMHSEFRQERSLQSPSTHRTSPNPMALVMGGEESEPGTRRPSQESKRSIDLVRKSLDRSRTHFGRRVSGKATQCFEPTHHLAPISLRIPRIRYLLVSPLLPPVSSLATFFSHSHTISIKGPASPLASGDIDYKLVSHPTLAIYGEKDFFVSQHKLRTWAEAISKRPSSMFSFHAIADAGHFWHERSSEVAMRQFVRDWLENNGSNTLKSPIDRWR